MTAVTRGLIETHPNLIHRSKTCCYAVTFYSRGILLTMSSVTHQHSECDETATKLAIWSFVLLLSLKRLWPQLS